MKLSAVVVGGLYRWGRNVYRVLGVEENELWGTQLGLPETTPGQPYTFRLLGLNPPIEPWVPKKGEWVRVTDRTDDFLSSPETIFCVTHVDDGRNGDWQVADGLTGTRLYAIARVRHLEPWFEPNDHSLGDLFADVKHVRLPADCETTEWDIL